MKKILTLLVVLMLLTACTSTHVKLKNNNTLFTLNGKSFTDEDVFNQILSFDYGQLLIREVELEVIESIKSENNYNTEERVNTEVSNFETYAKMMGVSLENFMRMYGINDHEEFVKDIERSIIIEMYSEEKAKEALDSLIERYNLYQVKVYTVESEEIAQDMMRYYENGYEADLFEEEFDLDKYETFIYHNQMKDVGEDMQATLAQLPQDKITYGNKDGKFEVIVYQEDFMNEDEVIKTIITQTDYAQSVLVDEVKAKGFKVINKTLKKNLEVDFSQYIK